MSADMICPKCAASMQGDPVPAEYHIHHDDCDEQKARNLERWGWVDTCHCLPYGDTTHFSRVMGHEVRGVYDGVLFWSCPDCGHAWPRWTDGGRLTVASAKAAAEWNAERGAA